MATASRANRRVPGSQGSPPPSIGHGESCASSAHRGRRSYSPSSIYEGSRGPLPLTPSRKGRRRSLMLAAHSSDILELALEIHVVRQLKVLDEPGRLDVVRVIQHELHVLRGRGDLLAQLFGAHGAIDQRHRHGFSLAKAEHQAISAGELRRYAL